MRETDTPSVTLLVFSKTKDHSEAKTRLRADSQLPKKTDIQSLHAKMVDYTLNLGIKAKFHHRAIYWLSEGELPDIELYANNKQEGSSFWKRLSNSIEDARKEFSNALIVIGTDCPGLTEEILEEAIKTVKKGEVSLGPAQNGGFYLLGIPETAPRFRFIDEDIIPGKEIAHVKTLLKDLTISELPFLRDIDYPEDFIFYQNSGVIKELLSSP